MTKEELEYINAIEYLDDDKISLKIEFCEDSAMFQLRRLKIILSNSFYLKHNILEQVKDIIHVLKRGNSQEIQLYFGKYRMERYVNNLNLDITYVVFWDTQS